MFVFCRTMRRLLQLTFVVPCLVCVVSDAVHVSVSGLPRRTLFQAGHIDLAYIFGLTERSPGTGICQSAEWAYKYSEAAR